MFLCSNDRKGSSRNGIRENVARNIESFFARHRPEVSRLVLDSTGPCLAKHYLLLEAIGPDPLAQSHRAQETVVRDVGELLASAIRVPKVYGHPSADSPYYDAVFAPGYRQAYRNLVRAEMPTLVSTPWRAGIRGDTHFVDCFQ